MYRSNQRVVAARWSPSLRRTVAFIATLGFALGSIACGSGSGSGSDETEIFGTTGIPLPSEVSAVSSKSESEEASVASLMAQLEPSVGYPQALENLPADSDYRNVVIRKFVEVKALEVFQILSSIFDAVRQTHYEDHVGEGWYKTMVAFKDTGGDGSNQTRLEEWYVNSRMFEDAEGNRTNRVQLKIVQNDGGERLIRVETDVRQAPTLNDDGTLTNMGAWEIRAIFGEEGESSFHATAEVLESGASQVTLEESFVEEMNSQEITMATRALIIRSEAEGYGKVEYSDMEACWGPDAGTACAEGPPTREVQFSYNDRYLKLQVGESSPVSFDREDAHELVHRYSLFDSTTGEDIDKSMNFGFPVRDENGNHGWYGAWQDRHDLWLDGNSAQTGVAVTREGLPPDQTPPTYTTKRFPGALTKVTLEQGSMDQLDGVVAEVSMWNDFRLRWNATNTRWDLCIGDDGMGGCDQEQDFSNKLGILQMPSENDRKWVYIGGCNEVSPGNWTCTEYVYDQGAFWVATQGEQGLEKTEVQLNTGSLADGAELWASVGGQVYIEYTGEFGGTPTSTGWVEKTITGFNDRTWTPTFNDEADKEFVFEVGREYFVHQRGSNLRVTRTAENGNVNDYAVYMEVHRVAKPGGDLSTFLATNAKLVDGWDPEGSSKYVIERSSSSPNYLLLVFDTVSDRDEGDGYAAGDVVPNDMWGLRIDGDNTSLANATLYNWEYQSQNESWGGVTYLVDSESAYVLLDEPLRFDAIPLARTDDLVQERPQNQWLSYSLGYDGWLHGVPDPWFELHRIGYEGAGIGSVLANNVRIPDGTELTDEADDTYFVKAVDIGIFLGQVDAFPNGTEPSLSLAAGVNLDTSLPEMDAVTMTTTIPDVDLLYIEGKPVTSGEEE